MPTQSSYAEGHTEADERSRAAGGSRDSFYALQRPAAPGVDGVTWKEYEEGLEERLADLHDRVHRGAYRAQPSKRTYIPKGDGRQRPLGIAARPHQPSRA